MRKLRFISAILFIATLFTLIAGCSDSPAKTDDTTAAAAGTTALADSEATTAEPAVTIAEENLKNSDGTPLTFNMLVRKDRYAYLYAEDATGDPISNAVYSRNTLIEEKYGIDIVITEGAGSQSSESANFTAYLTGADASFDLVCFDYWWNLELKGYFCNLKTLDEIDTDDSWWYQGWNDNITLNNKLYSIVGDANLEILENLEAIFYNKDMAKDRNLDLYADVSNGKWTIDRMLEVCKTTAANLEDADDSNNIYGAIYDKHSIVSQLFSAGLKIAEKSADGTISMSNVGGENHVTITDAVTKLVNDVSVNYSDKTARARDWSLFKESRAMIYATALYQGKALRAADLDFDYGIIPMPKLSESDEYISSPYGVSVFAIPVNVSSQHNSALILNALSFYSSNAGDSLVPTFYDLVLKYQIADCTDDVKNLDLIRDNVYVDFAFIYDVGYVTAYRTAVASNVALSSQIASVKKVAERTLNKNIIDFYNAD